ncbi:hypothetical protein [Actinokineospora sp.]|uniref:hypothetical protein n=1 Tax=Actinokineospora sp. TaxID=1872133 RepID=UPI0040384F51
MNEFPPRYRDYLSSPGDLDPQGSVHREDHVHDDRPFEDSVVIGRLRGQDVWHAVWQGEREALGEFDGTRTEAIAWARDKSPRCLIYSEAAGDVVPLGDDEPGKHG